MEIGAGIGVYWSGVPGFPGVAPAAPRPRIGSRKLRSLNQSLENSSKMGRKQDFQGDSIRCAFKEPRCDI